MSGWPRVNRPDRIHIMRPAIIVVAYSRPHSLARLLTSLAAADLDGSIDVPLVISIDHGGSPEVENIATRFEWLNGPKSVIVHAERMGLRKHVLWCGDLAVEHGSAIILEDDLYVSPAFYRYAVDALSVCAGQDRIAGISLYSMRINEGVRRPFEPIDDGGNVYFLQLASSWGQIWTAKQWTAFRRWYDSAGWENGWDGVPSYIQAWPETSWKKYFTCYLVHEDRFFMYPRSSLTTNFGDAGTHARAKVQLVQVPLLFRYRGLRYSPLEDAIPVYDAYMEIVPRSFHRLNPQLEGLDLEVDLYGSKPREALSQKPFVLTSRSGEDPAQTFCGSMRPHETGALLGVAGEDIRLLPGRSLATPEGKRNHPGPIPAYDYPLLGTRDALTFAGSRLWDAVTRWFRSGGRA